MISSNSTYVYMLTFNMKWFVVALLICTGLVAAQFDVTRLETGDSFVWSSSSIDSKSFTDNTANDNGHSGQCENALTYSTENNECVSYHNEGEWSYTI